VPPSDYCRQIEAYLCRKNEGHLIRIVGPAFDMVRAWEDRGIPLKVAWQGIDRTIARREVAAGPPRRRPVRVEFCEPDVLDAFDAWRRAVGVAGLASPEPMVAIDAGESAEGSNVERSASPRRPSPLHRHIDRAMSKLTQRRLDASLPGELADAIDAALTALDGVRARARGARGAARTDVRESLAAIDETLAVAAVKGLSPERRAQIDRDARRELQPFVGRLTPEAHARAVAAATARLVKGELDLPDLVEGL
jgi:hypothetical protein